MENNRQYEILKEKELKWLWKSSGISPYNNCTNLVEVDLLYKKIFPSIYEGSVRRWMGGSKGIHLYTYVNPPPFSQSMSIYKI